jgi:pyruvate/2-oxoglutarate/acetoin dehydrogenase E1 component
MIAESIPEYLLAPIKRVTAIDTPVPFSPVMENYYVPSVEKIKEAVKEAINY